MVRKQIHAALSTAEKAAGQKNNIRNKGNAIRPVLEEKPVRCRLKKSLRSLLLYKDPGC